MDKQATQWLLELTDLPTAAGREQHVIHWVRRWAKRRRIDVQADRFGNLTLRRENAPVSDRPIYITAHMDHPAMVVIQVESPRQVIAELRGGVQPDYFQPGTPVWLHQKGKRLGGRLCEVTRWRETAWMGRPRKQVDQVRIELNEDLAAQPGDIVTWDVGDSRIEGNLLRATACDDLAGVAAALAALVRLRKAPVDVRVLLTRAEEVGFIGAIAAAKHRTIPRKSRLICLENSKSFAESPIGGGPIVRVGDAISTFDPELTFACAQVARELADKDANFQWQRKLMDGGSCEASAFHSYGYQATCLCLPLGNYHNMDEQAGRIAAEFIDVRDYLGLVRLLERIAGSLDDDRAALRPRLEDLLKRHRHLLD